MAEVKSNGLGNAVGTTGATVGKPQLSPNAVRTAGSGGSVNPNSVGGGSTSANSGGGSSGKDSQNTGGNAGGSHPTVGGGSDGASRTPGRGGGGEDRSSGGSSGGNRTTVKPTDDNRQWKPIADDKLSEKGIAGKAVSGKVTETTCCEGLATLFATIAVFTKHPHWERTEEECLPIAVPLARMISRMPQKTINKIYELVDPAFLIGGIVQVAGPSVREEIDEFNANRGRGIQRATYTDVAGDTGKSRINGGNSNSIPRNGEGIPTANAPFIGKAVGL